MYKIREPKSKRILVTYASQAGSQRLQCDLYLGGEFEGCIRDIIRKNLITSSILISLGLSVGA